MSKHYTSTRREQYRAAEGKRRAIADERRAARAMKLRARVMDGGKK